MVPSALAAATRALMPPHELILVAIAQHASDDAALAVLALPAKTPRAASVEAAAPAAAALRHRCTDPLYIQPPVVSRAGQAARLCRGRETSKRLVTAVLG